MGIAWSVCATGALTDEVAEGIVPPDEENPFLPVALAVAADGGLVYVAGGGARRLAVFDVERERVVRTLALPGSPSGLAIDTAGERLFIAGGADQGAIWVVDLAANRIRDAIRTGHTPMSPVLGRGGRFLFVALRYNDCVAVVDLTERAEVLRIPVAREPVALASTPDGEHLLVANHLPRGRADADRVAATVSVIDVPLQRVIKEIPLPNGSSQVRGIAVSPDGRWAAVTHLVARFNLPATQVERAWINGNALSLIDLATMQILESVLLDKVDQGAANPWGVGWSKDGRRLVVAHAGTHELSVIESGALLDKLRGSQAASGWASGEGTAAGPSRPEAPANDLGFLAGLRRRVALSGVGPRSLVVSGAVVWAACHFSDELAALDLEDETSHPTTYSLARQRSLPAHLRGEMLFNDARLCYQGWQSCASCHSQDGRVDGFNWDLPNDGLGNPKNTRSLLFAHRTPPAMSLAVRADARAAVRAGLRHILFTVQPEEVAVALDEYLDNLKPTPSPFLVEGGLSVAARRGERVFLDPEVGCARCHPPGLFTDRRSYDVGTRGQFDRDDTAFDTPTLVELWRTAPFLHDGSATTVEEVLTALNPHDEHGRTRHLTPAQIDDLAEYLLSL